MNPLIITAAITGAETTKKMNPALPVSPKEQAIAAAECVEAGACVIHLHVRDKKGRPSQKVGDFRASIEAINAACNPKPIIQISTGGAIDASIRSRIAPVVALKPEMASLNIASMNFGDEVFINRPADVRRLAKLIKELGVVPEVEVYDAGHIEIAKRLVKDGLLANPIHYQFVLGVPGGLSGETRNLKFMVELIDPLDTWAVAGIGRYELPLAVEAISMGGHVRVGFEDNIFYQKGILAKTNAELVARIAGISKEKGRALATPEITRGLLGIAGGNV